VPCQFRNLALRNLPRGAAKIMNCTVDRQAGRDQMSALIQMVGSHTVNAKILLPSIQMYLGMITDPLISLAN